MKIEDCEVGMKLECLEENYPNGFHKGDVLTVKEIINKAVRFEKSRFTWNICSFKPANKFEVGDEVIWQNDKVKIWGIAPEQDFYDCDRFGIYYKDEDGKIKVDVVQKFRLSPIKKKDELEVGDKFRNDDWIIEILAKEYCEEYKGIQYFGKTEDGFVNVWTEDEVDEIIYE